MINNNLNLNIRNSRQLINLYVDGIIDIKQMLETLYLNGSHMGAIKTRIQLEYENDNIDPIDYRYLISESNLIETLFDNCAIDLFNINRRIELILNEYFFETCGAIKVYDSYNN